MDRLDAMRVVIAAVDNGSLSAASRVLHQPLPTVSRKISELEDHLGIQLLTRTSRKVLLTEAGESYVRAAREILSRIEEVERQARGEYLTPKGDLTMTAPIVFGRLHVLPVVTDFLKAFPAIDMQLILSDRSVNMADDQIDVALRIGELPDATLIATKIGAVRNTVYGSPGYLEHHPKPLRPGQLVDHAIVAFEGVRSARYWNFLEGKKETSALIRPRLSVNTAEAAIDAAVAGLGLTRVMSYQARRASEAGLLVPVLEEFEKPPSPVQLLHLQRGALPQKLRAFLDFAAPRLRAALK